VETRSPVVQYTLTILIAIMDTALDQARKS